MEFDALAALLDSTIHLAGSGLCSVVIADSIERDESREVVLIGFVDSLYAFLIGEVAIVVDVISSGSGMIEACGSRILLRRAGDGAQQSYHAYYTQYATKGFSHYTNL